MAAKRGAIPRPSPTKPKAGVKAKGKAKAINPAVKAAADRAEMAAGKKRGRATAKGKATVSAKPKGKDRERVKGAGCGEPAPTPPLEAPRPVGRPTEYRPELCDLVRALGSEGKSKAQISAKLGISRQCWYNWQEAHAEFVDAVKDADWLAQAHWEDLGYIGIQMGKDFNGATFIFQMKNRFAADYRETVIKHHSTSDSVGALIVELDGTSGRFRKAA
jgi:transposase